MTQEEYIKDRVEDQINWYGKKSSICQKKHKHWQIIKIVTALLITTLSLWANYTVLGLEMTYIVAILGGLIVFIESFVKIYNYEQLWIQYRATAEKLKREKIMYETKSNPYKVQDSFALLVQRCEAIMQDEVQGWVEIDRSN